MNESLTRLIIFCSTSGDCHLYIAQEVVFSFNLAVAFRTKSPYRELANYWCLS